VDTLAFAKQQQWADQEVVVSMLVAGALLKEKRTDEAVAEYQRARQSALQAAAVGHPAGNDLVLQTWFGEAGAHLAAGDCEAATKCYDQAEKVARHIPNWILAIEALRMGAFCQTQLKRPEEAIQRGTEACLVGEQLEPDARANSTLPIAAFDVLRLVDPERTREIEAIKHRMEARQKKAQETAEQQASMQEETAGPEQAQRIEQQLGADKQQAAQSATKELDLVVAKGSERFGEVFGRARVLLGPNWPLLDPIAIPSAPATEGVAVS
jgi:hypothetical protein